MNTVVGWGVGNVIWQIDFARNRVPLGLLQKGELSGSVKENQNIKCQGEKDQMTPG